MAHVCPECGQICYCNGDIDDVCWGDSEAEINCHHCPFEGEVEEDEGDDHIVDAEED